MQFEPQTSDFEAKLSASMGVVLGVLFIAGGFWVRHLNAYEQATMTETQGTVVDSVSWQARDRDTTQTKITYAPVIEFLANGDRVRFTGRYTSSQPSKGNGVLVRYSPTQPSQTAQVVEPLEGLTTWGMFGMGGLAVCFSLPPLLPVRIRFSRQQP